MTPGLFDGASPAPLAERMRPRSLDEVVGHRELVGEGGLLRALVARGELPSMVLWGPPGSGKTTLARLLATAVDVELVAFSAVLSGVKEAREVMTRARTLRRASGRRTVLFVDEIHRFNRAQQDAFLPFVEAGDIVLLGATTENPSFELNRALLSRLKVYILEPLGEDELATVLRRALVDPERGLGGQAATVEEDALQTIARMAAGDARQALTLLEVAVALADGAAVDAQAVIRAAQRSTAVYDKDGEQHFNLISALHKAVRNSDPDAALYWLARMLEGGADPRYVVRRMLRMASEDVGMAEPRALEQAVAAAAAVEHVGMPECALALAQAAVYLALAPKSNALYLGYGAAREEVQRRPGLGVPLHLRNAPTGLMKDAGYGHGYRYAHDEAEGVAAMSCLPPELEGAHFYRPTGRGWEARIRERLAELERLRRGGGSNR